MSNPDVGSSREGAEEFERRKAVGVTILTSVESVLGKPNEFGDYDAGSAFLKINVEGGANDEYAVTINTQVKEGTKEYEIQHDEMKGESVFSGLILVTKTDERYSAEFKLLFWGAREDREDYAQTEKRNTQDRKDALDRLLDPEKKKMTIDSIIKAIETQLNAQ